MVFINLFCAFHQRCHIEGGAFHGKIRGIHKRMFQIDGMRVRTIHIHKGEDELFRQIERSEYFVAGNGDGIGPDRPSLYFNKTQAGRPLPTSGT